MWYVCGMCNQRENDQHQFLKHCFMDIKKDNKGKKGHKNTSDQDEMCMITKSKEGTITQQTIKTIKSTKQQQISKNNH